MVDIRSETLVAMVSSLVSAGDGRPYTIVQPQPATLENMPLGAGVSMPGGMLMLEALRRCFTHVTTPSATLTSGGSAGSVALTLGLAAPTSGVAGKIQGIPFYISAAGTLSAQPTSNISTASTTIRKVLVTLGLSAVVSGMSSLALAGGTLQFVYGSAFTVSAGAVTSGGPGASYFDLVPQPLPSAHEVPVALIYVPCSFATSAGISNTMMITDFRAIQGMNFSAMMQGMAQP